MKKVFIYFIVIIIVYLSFCMPNIIFSLEDLKMENTSYKKKPTDSKIDVQAESIYLVKAIHDIQDGSSNLKISNSYSEISVAGKSKENNNKIIKYLLEETRKMQINDNQLEHLLEKYADTDFKYYIYGKEYNNSKKEYRIYRIVFQIDNYEIFVEIEEKTCKILSYVGIPKNKEEGISEEQILRNYIRYLDLYIINDWTYKNNMLVSEKAKLAVNIVYYDNIYIISIHSLTNEYILDILKMDLYNIDTT